MIIVNRRKSRTLALATEINGPGRTPELPYDYNRVKTFTPGRSSDKRPGSGKERVGGLAYSVVYRGQIVTPICADFRMGRSRSASVVYCEFHCAPPIGSRLAKLLRAGSHPRPFGVGDAGGGGYHKESAALDAAIADAGFALDHPISGCGDLAMKCAMLAIADYMGLRLDGAWHGAWHG